MSIHQIQPRANFPISRLLPDLGDNVTYYVQAIVRNAATGVTISTVNLPTIGNRLYAALWHTPADSSGQGLYVTITTTAFFDASYTQPATTVYSAESDTFLIFDQYNYIQQMSTQIAAQITVPDLDYKKIRRIVEETVAAIKFPEDEDTDYAPYFRDLKESLATALAAIKFPDMPEYPTTDLVPLLAAIQGSETRLQTMIKNLPPPEKIKELDLAPILKKLNEKEPTMSVPKSTLEDMKWLAYMLQELRTHLSTTLRHLADQAENLKQPKEVPAPPKVLRQHTITRSGAIRT